MARPNYGSQAKKRTKRLLEALLAYANNELENCDCLQVQVNWQTENQLVVRTKVRFLEELTVKDPYEGKLNKEQIKEALKRLEDFLEILEDNRTATRGAENWHFTLKLWHKRQDQQANLKQFDAEWERRRPEKSKQVADKEASALETSLANVVMEYITERLVEQVFKEIATEKVGLLMSHPLIKATAKNYVRESQIRLILEPIAHRLCTTSCPKDIEYKLNQLLSKIRDQFSAPLRYASESILNLFRQLKIDLTDYEFSNLTIWQAYLREVNLHQVNFAYAALSKSVFTETFSGILSVAFSPDGRFLATGDTNGDIRLLRVEDSKQLFTCKGHTSWVWSVGFSPNSQTLVSGSFDQTVRLWDVHTGQCLRVLQQG